MGFKIGSWYFLFSQNETDFQAKDEGVSPLVDFCSVIIYVLDANDHSPVFSRPYYGATVQEDLKSGAAILQVQATDADASELNSRVVYRIADGAIGKFTLHPETGILSLAPGASLDPDQTEPPTVLYRLEVSYFQVLFGLLWVFLSVDEMIVMSRSIK